MITLGFFNFFFKKSSLKYQTLCYLNIYYYFGLVFISLYTFSKQKF